MVVEVLILIMKDHPDKADEIDKEILLEGIGEEVPPQV